MKKHILFLTFLALFGTHAVKAENKTPADANKPLAQATVSTQPTSATTVKTALTKVEVQRLAALLTEQKEVKSWFARNKKHLLIETTLCAISLAMAVLWYVHVRHIHQQDNRKIGDTVAANDAQARQLREAAKNTAELQRQITALGQQIQAAQSHAATQQAEIRELLELSRQLYAASPQKASSNSECMQSQALPKGVLPSGPQAPFMSNITDCNRCSEISLSLDTQSRMNNEVNRLAQVPTP